jgi:phosphohistidine phosphatase SixA
MRPDPSTGDSALPVSRAFTVLRIAVALCFIGHGAFGILGKQAWLPYFGVVGIGEAAAWQLMPVVGALDIAVGLLTLVAPTRAGFAWAAVWTLWTAALRPLAGESVWELFERAGNYGVPLAILAWVGLPRSRIGAFQRLRSVHVATDATARVRAILVATTALLLIGHAGFGLFERKQLLGDHYAVLGLDVAWIPAVGAFELALALLVLLRPVPRVLLAIAVWKVASELLYPLAGAPMWEFIERGGSYLAPAAAALLPARVAAFRAGSGERLQAAVRAPLFAFAWIAPMLWLPPRGPERDTSSSGPVAAPVATAAVMTSGDTTLIARLRQGGLALLCRHAMTDRSKPDARTIDFEDRSTQRNLSAEGESQARQIGAEIRRLGIPIGDVRASQYFRTRESAELTFGRVTIDSTLAFNGSDDAMRRLLAAVPEARTNSAFMSHAGRIARVIDMRALGGLEEGDCAIVEPLGDSFQVAGRIRAGEWRTFR